MLRYLIRTVLPRFDLYATFKGIPRRTPGLDTIPRVPSKLPRDEVLRGLIESTHYGEVSPDLLYQRSLLERYCTPWIGAWFQESVYLFFAGEDKGGGGGWMPWIHSIISWDSDKLDPVHDEGLLHEHAHAYEDAKTAEGLWTPQYFTEEVWKSCISSWPQHEDREWAQDFLVDPLGTDPEGYNETFASTASRVMGSLSRLPTKLIPYYQTLFK